MIFHKALRRDLASNAGVVFAALFTIMVTTTLIRMLGRAAGGKVDTASLLPLIAFASLRALPVLLVLSIYIAVLMTMTRAYRDSEMVIWFASGRSLTDWVRPVMRFVLPFVAAIAVTSFVAAPWASRQTAEYTQRFEQREDVSRVSAGQFRESASGSRIFFIEGLSEDEASVSNVFVTQQKDDRLTIVVAANGELETRPDGERFVVLQKGRRYDGDRTGPAFRVMEFERYGLRLEPRAGGATDTTAKAKTTAALIADRGQRDLAELVWRFAQPISAVVVALLAIPLSSFNPRVGRSINLILALLVYVVYTNLVSLTQTWVGQGKIGFPVAVSAVHLAFLAIVALLFWRRLTLGGMWSRLRLRRRRA